MSLTINNGAQTWDALASRLETFIASWEAGGGPPSMADHLPDGSTNLKRLTLIELVKVDLEYRRQTGLPLKRVEEYVAEYPILAVAGELPGDLVYEEYHVRRASGEAVEPQEYFERFPKQADELRRLMGLDGPEQSLSLAARGSRTVSLSAGDQIDDFDLLIKLGQGAFAGVFLARQRSMQRLVALKVSADKGTEPQTLAQLDHPYIVRVYDQRRLPDKRLRLLYMQYVAGGTLQGVVERVRALPMHERSGQLLIDVVDAAVESGGQTPLTDSGRRKRVAQLSWAETVCLLGAQLAAALDYAHRKGVLHRDIKPANVLLAADLSPKLADFNISFSSHLDGATPASYFGGSLAYMSPEQLEACNSNHERQPSELDGRSDLYSLGVLLWELLYGSRPFVDEPIEDRWSQTLDDMAQRRRRGPPVAKETDLFDGNCETHLRRVLAGCLASEPADRPANGDALCRELLLCRETHARRLLALPRRGWRELARRWPLLAILFVALVPHALAGVFNWFYNRHEIVEGLKGAEFPHAAQAFWNVQIAINTVAFPLGILAAAYLAWPIARGLADQAKESLSVEELALARRRALLLGHYGALVGIFEWSLAGLAYPLSLHLLVGSLPVQTYLHFLASLMLCGLIAGAYPFFGITYLAVRVFYPALLRRGPPGEDDPAVLARVARLSGTYLLVAGGVPLLGVAALAITAVLHPLSADADGRADPTHALVLGIVSGVGVLGFLAAYGVYALLVRDLAALAKTAAPPDTFGAATDSVGLF